MFKTTIQVEGMMCSHCEKHMEEAVKAAFREEAVKKVKASHEDKTVLVESKNPLSEEKMKEIVTEAGYSFSGMVFEEKKGIFG